MPQYQVSIARRPTHHTSTTTMTAKSAAEAMQKVQASSFGRDNLILGAEPTTFQVRMARKPQNAERQVMVTASTPQMAQQIAERNNPLFVVVGIMELKR